MVFPLYDSSDFMYAIFYFQCMQTSHFYLLPCFSNTEVLYLKYQIEPYSEMLVTIS